MMSSPEVLERVAESLERIAVHPAPFGPDVAPSIDGRTLFAGAAVGIRAGKGGAA